MPELAWIQLSAWICMECLEHECGTIIVKNDPEDICGHCGRDMIKVRMSCKRFYSNEKEKNIV